MNISLGVGDTRPPNDKWVEKIVVGHNVSFDRAKIKEQYFPEVGINK